jgi:prenyltransferase beta subunit
MHRVYFVFLVALIPLHTVQGQTAEQKKATVAYVLQLQAPDGGFWPSAAERRAKNPTGSLRATTAALRVLKYNGGDFANKHDAQACTQFIRGCYDKKRAAFADHPGGNLDVITTAVGLMAVVELKLPIDEYGDTVKYFFSVLSKSPMNPGDMKRFEDIRMAAAGLELFVRFFPPPWVGEIHQLRNLDGTYGKGDGVARATASAVVALMRLGEDAPAGKERQKIVVALKNGQRPDGGFGKESDAKSDLESCYRVVRAFHMLHEKPDAVACLRFITRCRNADGGYAIAPGQTSTVAATYFASIIQHWLSEP